MANDNYKKEDFAENWIYYPGSDKRKIHSPIEFIYDDDELVKVLYYLLLKSEYIQNQIKLHSKIDFKYIKIWKYKFKSYFLTLMFRISLLDKINGFYEELMDIQKNYYFLTSKYNFSLDLKKEIKKNKENSKENQKEKNKQEENEDVIE